MLLKYYYRYSNVICTLFFFSHLSQHSSASQAQNVLYCLRLFFRFIVYRKIDWHCMYNIELFVIYLLHSRLSILTLNKTTLPCG